VTVDARLIEDIRNAPDDDGPRLVWADEIGGERGELVVIQLDLERGGLTVRETIKRKRRQRELLARHGAMWSGLEGIARRVSFRRGFVDAAELPAGALLEHAADLAEIAPVLSSLTVTNVRADGPASDRMPLLSKVIATPAMRALRGLELACEGAIDVADRTAGEIALGLVARAGMLPQLRALGSRDLLHMAGVREIAQPRALEHIERLWLPEIYDYDAMHAVLATPLPALRSFDLGVHGAAIPLLPPTIIELYGDIEHHAFIELKTSSIAAHLEYLDLVDDGLAIDHLDAFPRLRWLSIEAGNHAVPRARECLALRELAICGSIAREESLRMLVDRIGPQLELLDLRNSNTALRHVNELKGKVAGELLVGKIPTDRRRRGLLRVGPMTQLPWWDHVTLE
jgi:hypothetical protein